jgi:two-component system, sensor histidine kinase
MVLAGWCLLILFSIYFTDQFDHPMSSAATPAQPLAPLVFLDRLRELNRQVMVSTATAPLAWLLVAYLMSRVMPLPRVGLWLALMACAEGACLAMTLMLRRANPGIHDAKRWAIFHGVAAVTSGTAWGCSALLLWPSGNLEYQQILLLALCGVTAVGVISNAAMRRASIGLVLPMWGITITRLLTEATGVHLALAGLAVVFAVMMVTVGLQVTRTMTDSIVLRYENLALLDELRAARQLADEANQAKSEFLAAASHDLRQPVLSTSLLLATLAHLAKAPELDRAALTQVITQSAESLGNLSSLIDALLHVSKLDAGATQVVMTSVSIAQLFDELSREFSHAAQAKGLRLHVRMPTATALAHSDRIALRRLLGNLVDNAIRHNHRTLQRGAVLIACRQRGNRLLLEVWDNGPGIPLDPQSGSGLGLAIVQRLAAALAHSVYITSRAGQGSRIGVEVQREREEAAKID